METGNPWSPIETLRRVQWSFRNQCLQSSHTEQILGSRFGVLQQILVFSLDSLVRFYNILHGVSLKNRYRLPQVASQGPEHHLFFHHENWQFVMPGTSCFPVEKCGGFKVDHGT